MADNIEAVLSKLETLQETIYSVEKLQIKVHEQVKTINERGCLRGEKMNVDLEKKIMKEISFINKAIKSVFAASALLGAYLTLKK